MAARHPVACRSAPPMHHSTGSAWQVLYSTVSLLLSGSGSMAAAAWRWHCYHSNAARLPWCAPCQGNTSISNDACAVLVKYWFCCPWINLAAWSEMARVRFGWQWPNDRVPIPTALCVAQMLGDPSRHHSWCRRGLQCTPEQTMTAHRSRNLGLSCRRQSRPMTLTHGQQSSPAHAETCFSRSDVI